MQSIRPLLSPKLQIIEKHWNVIRRCSQLYRDTGSAYNSDLRGDRKPPTNKQTNKQNKTKNSILEGGLGS